MKIFVHVAGWVGTILIVLAYFLVSRQYITGASTLYQMMNLFGAFSMGINVFYQKAWPAVALQAIWAVIALSTLLP